MSALQTLIRRAEATGWPSDQKRADALREASKRVVARQEDKRLVVYIDGEAKYRTGNGNEGLWKWTIGDGDGWWRDADGIETPVYSWHQIVGYCQISGRAEVRSWVVDELATQEW